MVYTSLKTLTPPLLHRVQHWLLPSRCIACGGPGGMRLPRSSPPFALSLDLCTHCYRQLPFNTHACGRCSLPLDGSTENLICGRCLRRPPLYQSSHCAFEYSYPLASLIRNLKYGARLAVARVLGELLAQHLEKYHSGAWPECIVPVPLHAQRYQQRGYNQVIEVGRYLQHRIDVPLRLDLIKRIRPTTEQTGLSRRSRRKNLRRAFCTTTVTLPQHIAVLDDVITTGSTMNEIVATFSKAGVAQIEAWGLARAAHKSR
ncbi:MAG: double zinc ribbon domain-containing protein [Steroidobacteraceae bacterium]